MFRIMLLLCYSLIDTNTIPFYFSLSQIGRVESHTQRSAITVSFRRILLTLRQLYPRAPSRPSVSPCRMGRTSASTSLMTQLVQVVIPPQHGAFVGVQSSSGALKRLALKSKSETFSCVLPINSHTRRDVFEEINPPAGLSSIHSPTLGRVWYHAPWWRRYRRYRRCGQCLFGHLLW